MPTKKKTPPKAARKTGAAKPARKPRKTAKAPKKATPRKTAKPAKKAAPSKKPDSTDKLTVKQAAVAFQYVRQSNASAAYRDSYASGRMAPETIHRNACELLKNSKVSARVAALQAELAERLLYSLDRLLVELEEARLVAIDKGQAKSAVDAIMGKARLLGFDKPALPAGETKADIIDVSALSDKQMADLDAALAVVFPDMASVPPPDRRH